MLLRALAPFVAEPLTELFYLSLLTTEVPEDWWSAINTELSLRTAWDWFVEWKLPLNPDKCCHLPIRQPVFTPLMFAGGKSAEGPWRFH